MATNHIPAIETVGLRGKSEGETYRVQCAKCGTVRSARRHRDVCDRGDDNCTIRAHGAYLPLCACGCGSAVEIH